ncbi:MAG: VOC family protein [Ilumatobacteraceae bacterium]
MDHAAIPTDHPEEMIEFYRSLGFGILGEQAWREGRRGGFSLVLDDTKINVHGPAMWRDEAFTLRGPTALPGCGDFCFVWDGDPASAVDLLTSIGARLEEGPIDRIGGRAASTATGTSVYTRDPDGNLVELIAYPS